MLTALRLGGQLLAARTPIGAQCLAPVRSARLPPFRRISTLPPSDRFHRFRVASSPPLVAGSAFSVLRGTRAAYTSTFPAPSLSLSVAHERLFSSSHALLEHAEAGPESGHQETQADILTAEERFEPQGGFQSAAQLSARIGEWSARGRHMPVRMGAHWPQVLDGTKRVLEPDEVVSFSCNSCGTCCRVFPNNVMLGPFDLWLMSRSPGLFPGQDFETENPKYSYTTSDMRLVEANAFREELGMYLPLDQEVSDDLSQAQASAELLGPVCFLNADSSPQQQCHFAYSSRVAALEEELLAEKPKASGRRGRKKRKKEAARQGLRCRLGRDHMPLPCASYPFGELYTNGRVQSIHDPLSTRGPPPEEQPSNESATPHTFFVLDEECEGVNHQAAHKGTVNEYSDANYLEERIEQWEWFLRIATRFAAHRFVIRGSKLQETNVLDAAESAAFLDVVFGSVQRLWFDYDSVLLAPEDGWTHWYEVQHLIERGTNSLILAAEKYLSAVSGAEALSGGAVSPDDAGLEEQPEVRVSGVEHFSAHFQEMVEEIGRAGLLPLSGSEATAEQDPGLSGEQT